MDKKKVIIASDSFKGTLSQRDICEIAKRLSRREFPDLELVCLPIADGGEGTLACFEYALGGRMRTVDTVNHYGEPIRAHYLLLPDGTAVVEAAEGCGITISTRRDVLSSNSYGVGEILLAAAHESSGRILFCLGGSGSSDGGVGMLAALGYKFFDRNSLPFLPNTGTLGDISRIEGAAPDILRDKELLLLCDTAVPLCGKNGAAYVYAPQKGASPDDVELISAGFDNYAPLLGGNVGITPGGAAGGGIAAAALRFGGKITSGIDSVIDTVGLDDHLSGASLVITGEGRLDSQTLTGKAVLGITRRTSVLGVPVALIVGSVKDDITDEEIAACGISFVCTTLPQGAPLPTTFEDAALQYENALKYLLLKCF